MKKVVSILLLLAIFISFVPFVNAEDNFKVSQGIIESQDDELTLEVVMPIFEGFKGAEKVNEKVMNIYLNAIGQANASARSVKDFKEEMKASDEPPFYPIASLDMNYGYAVIGNILSVQLNVYSYAGGAHGMSQIINITSNIKTGEIYEFNDLFRENVDYKAKITDFILNEIEREDELYFPDYRETIENKNGGYEFFIDGDKLVVYFGLYDIAPYASGIRFFVIDSDDIKDLLKEDVYNSIKNGKEQGSISLNGKDINSEKSLINKEYNTLLPLRAVCEALGYKVDWNMKDGTIVDGKQINNIVKEAIILDGTTYVPLQYFKDVLGENVSLGLTHSDKYIIRIYTKESQENHILELMKAVESPMTQEEAVNFYAESVKLRNGVVQYALMDDQLRDEKYNEFKEMNFVTGTSSPWVDSYEISQVEKNLYQVIFTLKTSVSTDSLTTTVNIELVEDSQYIKISNISCF